ncbi:MAG: VWA domain-containing protein [Planctomycetaceae bacterium]|nr:VWA domain-containing protein [Planctomycetaceae bacterium]
MIWTFRRLLPGFSKPQRIAALSVRLVILFLLILSAAGLTFFHRTQKKMVVFLIDQSRSISANARDFTADYLKTSTDAAGKRPYLVIPFAKTPLPPVTRFQPDNNPDNDSDRTSDRMESLSGSGWPDETNIADAFRFAAAKVPPEYVPQIVILSDGNETSGDILETVRRAGVPVSTVPLPERIEPEVQLDELRVPPQVREGEPFFLELTIRSNRKTECRLNVYRDDFKVIEETPLLEIGENGFRFRQSLENRRQSRFTADVSAAEDTLPDNNRAEGTVFVGGKPRILLVGSDTKMIRHWASALREQNIETEIRPPEGIPDSLEKLENFDAVVFSDVPAVSLSPFQMEMICRYVRDLGGGFLMLGGEESFGPGGYSQTLLEEILPVRCVAEKEKEKPALAICLVIDRSDSMKGEKMEMAKDAAQSAAELLSPNDFVSVIAFDDGSHLICPIQSASQINTIHSGIAAIDSGGGTNIYPALREAFGELNRIEARLKHVILLTDGYSGTGDYDGIMRQMTDSRITVSTVGVGEADHNLLKRLAELGHGRYYACRDPQNIPQIFAKETVTASKTGLKEEPFLPQLITPTEVLAEVPLTAMPPLLGLNVTGPKPTSQVILASESGEPLLAWWRYGLGMSAAFTSDVKSRWGAEWLVWSEFPVFWGQVMRHIMRSAESRDAEIAVTRRNGLIRITIDAVNDAGEFLNQANGNVTVISPDLSQRMFPFSQTSPGRYEADVPESPERLVCVMSLSVGERTVFRQTRGIATGTPEEWRLQPTNHDLLRQLAEMSGGAFDPPPEQLFDRDTSCIVFHPVTLIPYLLTAAAFLFVAEVFLRRVDLQRILHQ